MNKISPILFGLSLAVAGSSMAAAQQASSASTRVPKVIQLTREFVKAGKAGAAHDKTESAFVQAMAEAKSPTHYTAICSLSGKSRCLYLTGYPSFDAWQKDTEAVAKNKDLSAKLDEAMVADGDLLDSVDQAVLTYDADMSYHAPGPTPQARYMEITEFHVREGHSKDWSELAKMYIAACEKVGTSAHWGMFHLEYGGSGGTYLLLSSDNSMAEIDSGFAEGKKIRAAMGEEGMKKFQELEAATVESANSQLFAINPRQSYVPDEWVKQAPDFWKPAQ
jgi:hypothetical protein